MGYRNLPVPARGRPAGVDGPGHLDQESVTPGAPAKEIRGALAQTPPQGQEPAGDLFLQVVGQPRYGAADDAASAKHLDTLADAARAAAREQEPRFAESPMPNHHLVAAREVGRDDSRELFGRGGAGACEQIVDVVSVDRPESNRFADRRLDIGPAVRDDYAATFIGRVRIGLWHVRGARAGSLAAASGVQGLDDGAACRGQPDLVSDRERGLEAVILDADLARFGGHLVAGALDQAKSPPTGDVDRPAVSLADQAVALERYDRSRGSLIQIVLDQLGDQIRAIQLEKEIPEARYPIGLGDEAGAIVPVGSFPDRNPMVGPHRWSPQQE